VQTPVQTELSLDGVKVIRNDLADSDSQVKTTRRPTATQAAVSSRTGGQPLGMVWNRLSARLLRQAAQEFTVVQKQRGRVHSQTGDDRGGSRGA
jgi:hypothetical protein